MGITEVLARIASPKESWAPDAPEPDFNLSMPIVEFERGSTSLLVFSEALEKAREVIDTERLAPKGGTDDQGA